MVSVLGNGLFRYNPSSQSFLANCSLPGVLPSVWKSHYFCHQFAIWLLFWSRCLSKGNLLFDPSPTVLDTVYKTRATPCILGVEQVVQSYLVSSATMGPILQVDGKYLWMKCMNMDDGLKSRVLRICPNYTISGNWRTGWGSSLSFVLLESMHLRYLLIILFVFEGKPHQNHRLPLSKRLGRGLFVHMALCTRGFIHLQR